MTLLHPFLEGSTAEAVIQVAKLWFWQGPSPELGRSTQPECSSMADSMVLYTEKSQSSLILAPAYGEAFSNSGSGSKVHFSGGSCTGIELSCGMGLNSEGILGYSVLCLVTNMKFKYGVTPSHYVTIMLPVHARQRDISTPTLC